MPWKFLHFLLGISFFEKFCIGVAFSFSWKIPFFGTITSKNRTHLFINKILRNHGLIWCSLMLLKWGASSQRLKIELVFSPSFTQWSNYDHFLKMIILKMKMNELICARKINCICANKANLIFRSRPIERLHDKSNNIGQLPLARDDSFYWCHLCKTCPLMTKALFIIGMKFWLSHLMGSCIPFL